MPLNSFSKRSGAGDVGFAQKRLEALQSTTVLATTDEARDLARALVEKGPLPPRAAEDALHIAVAVANGMDYLLTWNCKHLANAAMRSKIEEVCEGMGYEPVIICTPEELLEEE